MTMNPATNGTFALIATGAFALEPAEIVGFTKGLLAEASPLNSIIGRK